MEVLGDVVARDRRGDTAALLWAADRAVDYRRFCTVCWKTGNYLRHLGVHTGARVAIADDPRLEPIAAFYGTAMVGGVVEFGPPPAIDDAPRVLVGSADTLAAVAVEPATKRLAYGDGPTDPAVSVFARDVWSENPVEPPDTVAGDAPVLATADRTYTHHEILSAAARVVDETGMTAGEAIAVRGPLRDPGVVAAGLVAPLLAAATIVLPDGETHCEYAVGDGPEPTVIDPARVLQS